ncbi:hypothetical protein LCGC14_1340360 [marine sediment metagenome]|uniref:Uncharacterized protein n=1 Tax=marine sediment metagenome TaxID=412755 RepID=A0A0F9MUU4_9ZZZZ
MEGTVKDAKAFSYSNEQAELLGQMDDLFEEAQKLKLCTGDEAVDIGKYVGLIFGKHTGKL